MAKKKPAPKKPEKKVKPDQNAIRKRVTDAMLQALTEGVPPWRQPWAGGARLSAPLNFLSKRHYRGINPLLLLFASMTKGHSSPYWGTEAAWAKKHKAAVRPGEEPTHIMFYHLVPWVENGVTKKNPKGQDILVPLMREYPLYNVEQMTAPGNVLDKYVPVIPTKDLDPDFAPAEALIDATNAEIHYKGLRAVYEREQDRILCPKKNTFDSLADFYETIFHELAHWCEHPKRVGQRAGHQYAFGELVAEIAACMILLEIGVPMAEQMLDSSRGYVKVWAERMGNDPKFIFDAATQASKVVDYLLAFQKKEKCAA